MRAPSLLFAASLGTLILGSALLAADKPHPFTPRDMQAMDRISDPQPSPRGDRIAFVMSSVDFDANRRRSDLWSENADGSGLARLTAHEAGDSNPRWGPDGGSLYFLSTRSGSSQVW